MKSILVFIMSLFLVIHFSGCTLLIDKMSLEIEDQNGDDISLAVLSDEDICADLVNSYCAMSTQSYVGENSFPEENLYTHDRDKVEATAKTPFSGVGIVQITYGKSDTIVFTVTSQLTSGNLRIVLLDYDNLTILHDFAVNTTDTFTLTNANGGEYDLRIAGESAEFSLSVSRVFPRDEDVS